MTGVADKFGPFVFERERMTLLRDGDALTLGGRVAALLAALVDANGAIVGKEALMEAAWPGTIVEEGNLSVQIAALRKALGRRTDGSEWIATVPRVGYRLVQHTGAAPQDGADPRLPLLAVLPFQNLSSDPEQQYLADGIAEDVITALNRFRALNVIARSSSFSLRDRAMDARRTAAELGAQYVLEGSVRRAGIKLRIAAQLIDAAAGVQIWAHTFDGETNDIFEFQDRITAEVTGVIEPTVTHAEIERSRRKPPSSLDAYDLYLQALATVLATNQAESARSIELIERSLAIDPTFPPALAVAANAYMAQFDRQQPGASEENRLKGLRYAKLALAAAGTDANTRAVAGLAVIMLGQEYEMGLAALRHAATENPYSVTIMGYAAVAEFWAGSVDEAERYAERAAQLDPHQAWTFAHLANIRLHQRRYDESLNYAASGHALDPQNPIIHWFLSAANAHAGHLEDARRWREALQALDPNASLTSIRRGQPLLYRERIDVVIDGLRMAGLPER